MRSSWAKRLQLTNILRDVKNDAARSRIYLPQAELRKAGVQEADILGSNPPATNPPANYAALTAPVAARAKFYYGQARKILPPEDHRAMVAAELMGSVYWQLLRKLEREQFNVFGPQPGQIEQTPQAGPGF